MIDLSKIRVPDAISALDYESILTSLKQELSKEITTLDLESSPIVKLLEVFAYRELALRAKINDSVRAVMLSSAKGNDLDNLGTLFGVSRKVIQKEDLNLNPPKQEIKESDEAFRARIQLAPESYTVAGSINSYIYHVLASHKDIKDASVQSPHPGEIEIYVLGNEDSGALSQQVIDIVSNYISSEEVRPLGDHVVVQNSEILNYTIDAKVHIPSGPDSSVIKKSITAKINEFVSARHKLGQTISFDGIYAAMHEQNVIRVELNSPTSEIIASIKQAPYCTDINIEMIIDG